MSTELLARADRLRVQRTPFVLATVVRAERPTSAKAGDRAIVMSDGTIEGFVGGVCAESTVRAEGLRLLGNGSSTLLRITPPGKQSSSASLEEVPPGSASLEEASPGSASVEETLGPSARNRPGEEGLLVVENPCLSGGTLDIFLEAVLPAMLVHVFGDAPIARALAHIAEASGYDVTLSTDPAAPIDPDTSAMVVASHGRHEEAVLAAALRAGIPYVGLVASPRRGAAVLSELDVPEDLRSRVRTPAGLDIGARTPLEIAVSVVAELVSVGAALRPAPSPRRPPPVVEETVTAIDPVCGMSVAAVAASLHLDHAGRTWYFCGPGCRQAFADDPLRYGT